MEEKGGLFRHKIKKYGGGQTRREASKDIEARGKEDKRPSPGPKLRRAFSFYMHVDLESDWTGHHGDSACGQPGGRAGVTSRAQGRSGGIRLILR